MIGFKTRQRNSGILLFLCLIGFTFITSHYNFIFGTTFTFASIFIFLIFRLFGLSWAFLTSLITLLFIPHHTINLALSLVSTAELVFVSAFFYKGRKAKMFYADGLFWLTLGSLSIYLIDRNYITGNALYFEICRHIINALCNVLTADMLLAYVPFYKLLKNRINKNNVSIHQFLSHITFILILIPLILVLSSNSRELFSQLKYLLLFAIFIIILVQVVSRIYIQSLKQLTIVTTGLPQKLINLEKVEWPESNVSELRLLVQNLMLMANKLKELFQESIDMNRRLTEQTKKLQESEDKLHQLAFYDFLTGLPNRRHFQNCIKELIRQDDANYVGIIFIDINQFKQINDTLGHDAGDLLLQDTAKKLNSMKTESRKIFRLGGDEFVMVDCVADKAEISLTIDQILKEFAEPVPLKGQLLYITASVGISIYPEDGQDLDSLVKSADIAMYLSKERGGNVAQFFNESMRNQFQERLVIENALRAAVDHCGFELFYQPKTLVGKVTSMEALLRWNDPILGAISPSTFIPIAEEIGLILQIDEWSLFEACKQNKRWQDAGLLKVPISVNLSAKHFQQNYLVPLIEKALKESRLEPQYLKLEITESVFIKNPRHVAGIIVELKNLGVLLSIDDFGKGYSSLYQLLQLPIDEIKIDRQFIQDIDGNNKKTLLVKSIMNMAHGLQLNVVAEGVETEKEQKVLAEMGCDELQGFLFSPPINQTDMGNFLYDENMSIFVKE